MVGSESFVGDRPGRRLDQRRGKETGRRRCPWASAGRGRGAKPQQPQGEAREPRAVFNIMSRKTSSAASGRRAMNEGAPRGRARFQDVEGRRFRAGRGRGGFFYRPGVSRALGCGEPSAWEIGSAEGAWETKATWFRRGHAESDQCAGGRRKQSVGRPLSAGVLAFSGWGSCAEQIGNPEGVRAGMGRPLCRRGRGPLQGAKRGRAAMAGRSDARAPRIESPL